MQGQLAIGAWMFIILMVLVNFSNMSLYGISSSSSAAYIIPDPAGNVLHRDKCRVWDNNIGMYSCFYHSTFTISRNDQIHIAFPYFQFNIRCTRAGLDLSTRGNYCKQLGNFLEESVLKFIRKVMISLEKFLELPAKDIAQLVRDQGSQVCVFPFNGTRRWFLLEHGRENHTDPAQAYIELTSKRYIEMYQMLFDHGLDTIIAPVFGGEILNRGPEYMEQIGYSMSLLAEHPYFLSFYEKYDVRVHFYGDYRKELNGTPYAYLCDLFDQVTETNS